MEDIDNQSTDSLEIISIGTEPPPCMVEKATLILTNSRTAQFAYITGKYEIAAMTRKSLLLLGAPGRKALEAKDPKALWEIAKKTRGFGAVQICITN